MSTMQKNKGKAFEKKIASFIHKLLYENVEEYKNLYDNLGNVNLKPKRESSSGTMKDADNDIDLGLGLKFFPYSIECKHHKCITETTLNALLDNKFSWIETVFRQANNHAELKKLLPLVIFRGNRTVDFVAFKMKDIDILNLLIENKINFIIYNGIVIGKLEEISKYLIKGNF